MHRDTSAEILTGIKAYLGTHFPDVEFTAKGDPKTHSVVLLGDGRPNTASRSRSASSRPRMGWTSLWADCTNGTLPRFCARPEASS